MKGNITRFLLYQGIVAVILIVAIEGGLRVAPELISRPLLAGFQSDLRLSIAQHLGLPNTSKRLTVVDEEGNDISIYKPGEVITALTADPGAVTTFTTDEWGFCNPANRRYDLPRIGLIAVGDSVTWCTTINPEESWVNLLGNTLGMSAYNLGIPATGPHQYLRMLKHFGIPKSPRIVVMSFYEGNEIRDALTAERKLETIAEGKLETSTDIFSCRFSVKAICDVHRTIQHGFIGRHSYTYSLLTAIAKIVVDSVRSSSPKEEEEEQYDARFTVALDNGSVLDFNSENHNIDEIEHAELVRSGEVSFSKFERPLTEYAALSKEHGFVPVILYFPTANTIYADRIEYTDGALKELFNWFSNEQREYLRKKTKELGIVLIDPTDMLLAHAHAYTTYANILYFPLNTHPTQRTYQLISTYAANSLINRGLLRR